MPHVCPKSIGNSTSISACALPFLIFSHEGVIFKSAKINRLMSMETIPPEALKAIQSSKLGQIADDDLVQTIARKAEIQKWPKKSLLFQEGDDAKGMYIVIKGIVKLLKNHPDGTETLLHLAEPSDTIAEAALFMDHYPATAVTDTPCELLLLRRSVALELIDTHAAFTRYLFDRMANWLKRLVEKVDELTSNDAMARVIRYLLSLIEEERGIIEGESTSVMLPVKKGDLATLLNMNQATLSRTLRRLQDSELISVQGRSITLQNPAKLKSLTLPPLD